MNEELLGPETLALVRSSLPPGWAIDEDPADKALRLVAPHAGPRRLTGEQWRRLVAIAEHLELDTGRVYEWLAPSPPVRAKVT